MNQKAIKNRLITAFLAHSEGHIKKHLANVEVLLSNPVGIGEHPQHIEEMDKLIATMVDAHDKLTLLEKEFSKFSGNK